MHFIADNPLLVNHLSILSSFVLEVISMFSLGKIVFNKFNIMNVKKSYLLETEYSFLNLLERIPFSFECIFRC